MKIKKAEEINELGSDYRAPCAVLCAAAHKFNKDSIIIPKSINLSLNPSFTLNNKKNISKAFTFML